MSQPLQRGKTLSRDAQAMLEMCAGVSTRRTARLVTQFLDRELAGCGLSIAQLALMAHIATAADDRIGALARRTGLDPSTLSRNVRVLEREGLIEVASVEADLRRRAVWLTETGARRLEAALPVWQRAHEALSRCFSPGLARRLADEAAALNDECGS